MLTQARLKELLSYDPETGCFTWIRKSSVFSNIKIGAEAGSRLAHGYRQIKIDGHQELLHRLAFLCVNGKFPVAEIDHINLDKSDNRWGNLREASKSLNHGNMPKSKRNTSGLKGAFWHVSKLRWYSSITQNGKSQHLGCFSTPEDAHAAYAIAAEKLFGEFARIR
jgi:hypothetical protein